MKYYLSEIKLEPEAAILFQFISREARKNKRWNVEAQLHSDEWKTATRALTAIIKCKKLTKFHNFSYNFEVKFRKLLPSHPLILIKFTNQFGKQQFKANWLSEIKIEQKPAIFLPAMIY